MYKLLNDTNEKFREIIHMNNDTGAIDWSEGLIEDVYMTINSGGIVILNIFAPHNGREFIENFIIVCKGQFRLSSNYWLTLSNMKVIQSINDNNGVKEQWWDLHIRDMSQNPDDPVPALLIRAKEFNIYEIEPERDEQGNIKDRPSLADFIKWKEEQEESKEMVNK